MRKVAFGLLDGHGAARSPAAPFTQLPNRVSTRSWAQSVACAPADWEGPSG